MEQIDVEKLSRIFYRADVVFNNAYDYLKSFWNPELSCFQTNKDIKHNKKVSMTNTSFCLFAILEAKELMDRFSRNESPVSGEPFFVSVAKTLLSNEWDSEGLGENNIYTAPIVLVALYRLREETTEKGKIGRLTKRQKHRKKKVAGLKKIIKCVGDKKAVCYNDYDPSAYLTYWSYLALRYGSEDDDLDEDLKNKCSEDVKSIVSWAESEVFRHIAFETASDLASFDATQLAYALMIYIEDSAEHGRRLNKKVVMKAIDLFFSEQQNDGLWPKGHPIFHYQTRGNVYTFTFEVLAVLLSMPDNVRALLDPECIGKLEASLEWVELNETIDEMKGWRSNLLAIHGGAEAWSTAAVFVSMQKIKKLVEMYLHNLVCKEFRAKMHHFRDNSFFEKDNYYDSEITCAGKKHSLKKTLKKYLVNPHLPEFDSSEKRYSAVFYGPPGTGKTTLAENIAKSLGWPYVYLQTSDFTGEGVDKITSNARRIFRRLGLLKEAVVLFDEVEEFVRNRDDKELPPQSRMITTTMLSLIQELRRRKNVIFIVATNYLERFDEAIKRAGGRFDMLLLIGPPSKDDKVKMFIEKASKKWANTSKLKSRLIKFVNANKGEIEFYNLHEWERFIDEVLQKCSKVSNVDNTVLKKVLSETKDQIIMHNKSNMRKDYEESKDQVRF